jgi:hypothetical protein
MLQVLSGLLLLSNLRRLRRLALDGIASLALLPQLHPLLPLVLGRLRHLTVSGSSPICALVLLRPYLAYRCGTRLKRVPQWAPPMLTLQLCPWPLMQVQGPAQLQWHTNQSGRGGCCC